MPPAAPAQVSGTGTVGGGGAWGAPRRRCGSGRRGRGSVPHRGPVTAGGGGAGSRGEAFSPSPHPGMNPEAEPTQPHRHPPGPGVPTRDHPHPRWRDARLLAQPVSSSASCPPAAVGCVGVGHPDTASPSARGDSDAGGEWGWGGVSASTVSVNRPVVPTDQCHAISSRWPFQDLLACETDGSRERSGTSPLSRTRGLGMWGDTYPGTGRRAAGRGEHPRNHRPPHRAAVKQQLKVPRAASSCSASGSCQPGLVPRGWTCLLVWLGTPTSLLELLWTSRCTPPRHAWAFPGEAARCWEWGDAACPLGGLLARQRGGQVDVE